MSAAGIAAALAVLGTVSAAAQAPAGPWSASDLMQPAELALKLKSGSPPVILYIGFPVLYRQAHIPGAILAGPSSTPAGMALLQSELAKAPKDKEVVLYCGCCPWVNCPNVRPAWQWVKNAGRGKVRLLVLPTNLSVDWIQKGYPTWKPGAASGR